MKLLLFILCALTLPLSARTPRTPTVHTDPLTTPAAASPIRPHEDAEAEYVGHAKQLTAEDDKQLNIWITGIMKEGYKAQAEAKALTNDLNEAKGNLVTLQADLVATQFDLIGSQKAVIQLEKDIADLKQWGIDQQTRADKAEKDLNDALAQLKHLSKLAHILAFILAGGAAIFAFRETKTTGLLSALSPATWYAALIVPVIVFGVVFSAVEVYLRYWL